MIKNSKVIRIQFEITQHEIANHLQIDRNKRLIFDFLMSKRF